MTIATARDQRRAINAALATLSGVTYGLEQISELHPDTRSNLDHWIAELRQSEAGIRRLRKRLEALRDGVDRSCPVCGTAVAGRPDAVYCSDRCRIGAHRQARRSESAK